MKKVMAMILALLMIFGGAMAEETVNDAVVLENGVAMEIDLDDDGANETVMWETVMIDEYDEEAVVKVNGQFGEIEWRSGMLYGAQVFVTDIDSNGLKEIFVTGDMMSSDYITYCLHYAGMMLEPLQFANVDRGDDNTGYADSGYGMITAMEGNQITLTGTQDVLGTWFASRTFGLIDGILEIVDDGYWVCDIDENDPEIWEYRSLNPVQAIPVTFIENGAEVSGEIQPGERIMLTKFNKAADVFFVTEDGREGYLTAAIDAEAGWGWTVNGISETEVFEFVPYAD